jgi:hypothetical protein
VGKMNIKVKKEMMRNNIRTQQNSFGLVVKSA